MERVMKNRFEGAETEAFFYQKPPKLRILLVAFPCLNAYFYQKA
jgi:hypothetical protein